MKRAFIISSEILFLAVLFAGCSSGSKGMSKTDLRPETRAAKKAGHSLNDPEYPAAMTIIYKNASTTVSLQVDPNDEDLFLQMDGGALVQDTLEDPVVGNEKKQEPTTSEVKTDSVQTELQKREQVARTAKVLAQIRKAQEHFYRKEYEKALDAARNSLSIEETAQGLALAGSIRFVQGYKDEAKAYWVKAMKLDPEMPAVSEMIRKLEEGEH